MAAPGDPPDGAPEGIGGDDEYRSVVFDEDFVRAARLQEFSAHERMGEHARAVRSRSAWSAGSSGGTARGGGRSGRQGLVLLLVVLLAFSAAVYMGLRNPYVPPEPGQPDPFTATVVPLAPPAVVPGGTPGALFDASPAAGYGIGAAGINLPAVQRTRHFSDAQVVAALTTAKEYLVRSALDPDALAGGSARPARILLHPDQFDQFDRSLARPAPDGRHAATGWLVRFDPAVAVVADPRVRVEGVMGFAEIGPDTLEVTTDHVFVYAVRPAVAGPRAQGGAASLFTVRRELRLRFDRDDLEARRARLLSAYVQAGPQDCAADPAGAFRPLLAGQRATGTGPAASDPYDAGRAHPAAGLCGTLAASALPSPAPRP
ncbi:hypothetical protein [Streptomyces sp. NPDC089919]|uniref:SCO2583 family membrane protein n=1 Tax=Streptomyces sp. NPDC089919 TaxID=3155188 RepID=UPI00343571BE